MADIKAPSAIALKKDKCPELCRTVGRGSDCPGASWKVLNPPGLFLPLKLHEQLRTRSPAWRTSPQEDGDLLSKIVTYGNSAASFVVLLKTTLGQRSTCSLGGGCVFIYIYVSLFMHNWAPHGPSGIQKLSISSAKSPPKKAESTVPVPDLHCRFLKQRAAPSKPGWELTAILRS